MSDFHPKNEFEAEVYRAISKHLPDGFGFILIVAPMGEGVRKFNFYSNIEPQQTPILLKDVAAWMERTPGASQ